MIPEVDALLRSVLAPVGTPLRFDHPGPDGAGAPAISALLHSVVEDMEARHATAGDVRDSEGRTTGRRPPMRRYFVGYLVTAWAGDPVAEHALLGEVLTILSQIDLVADEHLSDRLRDTGRSVQLTVAQPGPDLATPLWHALGIGPRPVLPVQVAASMSRALVGVADAPSGIDLGMGAPPARPKPAMPTVPRPTKRISEGPR